MTNHVAAKPDAGAKRRHLMDRGFEWLALGVLLLALAALAALIYDILSAGLGRLNWQFMTSMASRRASTAGIYHALAGSIAVIGVTAVLALPIGVAAAIYL